jgi:hypothetical protein
LLTTLLARLYPNKTRDEAARQLSIESSTVSSAFKLAVIDAAQVREHYC